MILGIGKLMNQKFIQTKNQIISVPRFNKPEGTKDLVFYIRGWGFQFEINYRHTLDLDNICLLAFV
jgi:hypothetical protein